MCTADSTLDSSCLVSTLKFLWGGFLLWGYFKVFLTFYTGSLLFSSNQGKMTAVLQSQLNPLACTFIPLNVKLASGKIWNSIEWEDKTKTTLEWINVDSNDWEIKKNTKNKQSGNIVWLGFSRERKLLRNVATRILNDIDQINLPAYPDSQLRKLSECSKDYLQELKLKSDPVELSKIEKENGCICPPMFGWSVPPEFFGNPFNFKYECRKKYPHSPSCTGKLRSLDKKLNQMTLDQCYSEFKDILTDIYVTVSVNLDSKAKEEEKHESEDDLKVPDDSTSLTETLIDDGVHPLLQSEPTTEEDESDMVEKVEKILERSLSPDPKPLNNSILQPEQNCDHVPCSVWCSSTPPAVKETFKKYLQTTLNIKSFDQNCNQPMFPDRRRVFKRSLSADDAPLYGGFTEDLRQTSTVESREILQDPNYFRMYSPYTLKNGKKYGSWDSGQFSANANESSMWDKFYGADSLWQPLPECNAAITHNQKLKLQKKGRETKRQKQ